MLYSRIIGTGKPLVLLHGWGFSGDVFEPLIAQYRADYQIHVIDLPGHGKSADVLGGLQAWSDAIIQCLPDNPILLGWSLGGLLAIQIAHKIKISQLILVASTPHFIQATDWQYAVKPSHFAQFARALKLNPAKGLKRFVSLQGVEKSQLKQLHQTICTRPASALALNQGLEMLTQSDLRPQLQQLTVPVLAILGKFDTLIPPQISHWYQQNSIDTQILKCAHLPFLDPNFALPNPH